MVDEALIRRVRAARAAGMSACELREAIEASVSDDDLYLAWIAAEMLDDDCALCLGQDIARMSGDRYVCRNCGDVMVRSGFGTLIASDESAGRYA